MSSLGQPQPRQHPPPPGGPEICSKWTRARIRRNEINETGSCKRPESPRTAADSQTWFSASAAARLLLRSRIVAAAQEERFTRVKHDVSSPRAARR